MPHSRAQSFALRLRWPWRQLALVCGRGTFADTLVERLEAARVGGRAELAAALRSAPAYRKFLIAAVDEDDAENARIVEAATDVLLERPRRGASVRIVAFAEDPELRDALRAREKVPRDGEAAPRLRLDLLAPAEACARRLLAVSPLEASADTEDGAALHLLILGADDFAWAVLSAAVHLAHGPKGNPLILTHVVPVGDAGHVSPRPAWAPVLEELADVRRIVAPLEDPSATLTGLARPLADRPPLTGVYVCLDDAGARVWARALRSPSGEALVGSPPLHLRMGVVSLPHEILGLRSGGGGELLESTDPTRLHLFGTLAERAALIDRDENPLEELARTSHSFYQAERGGAAPADPRAASRREWDSLEETYREASRRQAEHVAAKLRNIGLRVAPGPRERARLDEEEVECLARIEHARWVAERRMAGWRYGLERDNEQRIHPLLIPYDALSEELKDVDRMTVRLLAVYFERQRRGLQRVLSIGVIGDVTPGAERAVGAAIDLELRRIRTLWAPCHLALVGGFQDRTSLLAAAATRRDPEVELHVALERPVGSLLRELHDTSVRQSFLMALDRAATCHPIEEPLGSYLNRRAQVLLRTGRGTDSVAFERAEVLIDDRSGHVLARTF